MAAGLFELRKDPITGWWVATVVDRAFHRDRFAQAAEAIDDRGDCQNCRLPEGDGIRTRMLKDFAFHVVGTDEESREIDGAMAQVALSQARASGSWRTIVAPPGEHRPLRGPDRLSPARPELGRSGRGKDEPPLPRPVRPAADSASHRRGAGWGG